MNHLKRLWQHYGGLWRFAPGAMTVTHICAIGFVISAALMKRNPLAALVALVIILLAMACLVPACAALDMGGATGST